MKETIVETRNYWFIQGLRSSRCFILFQFILSLPLFNVNWTVLYNQFTKKVESLQIENVQIQVYSEPCRIYKMELLAKLISNFQVLTMLAKRTPS